MTNPYAAPSARTAGSPRYSHVLKHVYLGTYLASLSLSIAAFAVMQLGSGRAALDLFTGLDVAARLTALTTVIVGLVWLHQAWSALPSAFRCMPSGRRVSPAAAVGMLLFPCFGFYWAFAISLALSAAVGSALAHLGRPRRPARALAIAASALQLVPVVNLVVAPAVWFAYMRRIDASIRVLLEIADGGG